MSTWCWFLSRWCQNHSVSIKVTTKNKIVQWNIMLEVCKGKKSHHIKLFIWTKKMWQLAPSEKKYYLGADSSQSDAKNTLSLQKQPHKTWFFNEKACQVLFGAKQHITSECLCQFKNVCSETKWKQTSTWGWLLSTWCQQHTVTANIATQNMFFPTKQHFKNLWEQSNMLHFFHMRKKLDHWDQVKTNIKLVLNSVRMMQKHTVTAETTTKDMIF